MLLESIRQWRERYTSILSNKLYIYFLSIALFSLIGDLVAYVAAVWTLAASSAEPVIYTTSVVIVTQAASAIFSPIMGGFIDRYTPIKALIYGCWARVIVTGLLVLCIEQVQVQVGFSPWLLIALLGIDGAISPLGRHAELVLIQILVKEEDLTAANALHGIQFDLGYVIGPLLGGWMAASLGVRVGLLFDMVSFALYIWLLKFLDKSSERLALPLTRTAPFNLNASANFFLSIKEGFNFLLSHPPFFSLTLLGFSWNFCIFGSIGVIYPILVKDVFHSDASSFGMLIASNSIGFTCGLIIAGGLEWRRPVAFLLALCIAAHGLIYIFVGLSSSIIAAVTLIFAGGLITAPTDIFSKLIRQILIPIEYQGRVSAIAGLMGFGGAAMGAIFSGTLLKMWGTQSSGYILSIQGTILLIISMAFASRRQMKTV